MRPSAFWWQSRCSSRITPRSFSISSGDKVADSCPVLQYLEALDENSRPDRSALAACILSRQMTCRHDIRTKLHARALEVGNEILLSRKSARAVEEHVLQEMGRALLIILLQHPSHITAGPPRARRGWPAPCFAEHNSQSVVQLADTHGRIQWQRIGRIGASGLFGSGAGLAPQNRRHLNRLYRRIRLDRCRRRPHGTRGKAAHTLAARARKTSAKRIKGRKFIGFSSMF